MICWKKKFSSKKIPLGLAALREVGRKECFMGVNWSTKYLLRNVKNEFWRLSSNPETFPINYLRGGVRQLAVDAWPFGCCARVSCSSCSLSPPHARLSRRTTPPVGSLATCGTSHKLLTRLVNSRQPKEGSQKTVFRQKKSSFQKSVDNWGGRR